MKSALLILSLLILSTSFVLADEGTEKICFSIRGVKIGDIRSDVCKRLGGPDIERDGVLTYQTQEVRIGLSQEEPSQVITVSGESSLEFGGRPLVNVGAPPDEIHRVLGVPDSVSELNLSDRSTLSEFYKRFYITVFYKKMESDSKMKAVMFFLSSPEWERSQAEE